MLNSTLFFDEILLTLKLQQAYSLLQQGGILAAAVLTVAGPAAIRIISSTPHPLFIIPIRKHYSVISCFTGKISPVEQLLIPNSARLMRKLSS